MSWSVSVQMPGGDHKLSGMEVDETVVSFCASPGSLVCAVSLVGYANLAHLDTPEQCMNALGDMIAELEKGNAGAYSDKWAVECDQQWSGGRESRESWDEIAHAEDVLPDTFNTYEKWTGHWKRNDLRMTAQRFYMYYLAGCTVTFDW